MSYEDADDERSDRRGRKERVLHTRISERLEEDLRRAAEELRVPLSNLVRNVLEEAVSVVEAVSGEVGGLIDDVVGSAEDAAQRLAERRRGGRGRWTEAARAARSRAAEPAARPAPKVLGWQAVVLAEAQRCACGRELPAGSPAHLALTSAGPAAIYRCGGCVAGLAPPRRT